MAGKRAKYGGANFEHQFENLCGIQQVACERVPDGCKQVGANKLIRVASPFDYILAYEGKSAVVDLKSTSNKNFTHSQIKDHQMRALKNLGVGMISGYVIGFERDVYFAPCGVLWICQPGKSIDLNACKLLGQRLYFDVRKLFE